MEYQIVTANHPIQLGEYVRDLISQGWQPLGGVSVTSWIKDTIEDGTYAEETNFTFCQAMTRQRQYQFGKVEIIPLTETGALNFTEEI